MKQSIDGIITGKPTVLKRWEDVQFEKKIQPFITPVASRVREVEVKSEIQDHELRNLNMNIDDTRERQSMTDEKQSKLATITIQLLLAMLIGFLFVVVGVL